MKIPIKDQVCFWVNCYCTKLFISCKIFRWSISNSDRQFFYCFGAQHHTCMLSVCHLIIFDNVSAPNSSVMFFHQLSFCTVLVMLILLVWCRHCSQHIVLIIWPRLQFSAFFWHSTGVGSWRLCCLGSGNARLVDGFWHRQPHYPSTSAWVFLRHLWHCFGLDEVSPHWADTVRAVGIN